MSNWSRMILWGGLLMGLTAVGCSDDSDDGDGGDGDGDGNPAPIHGSGSGSSTSGDGDGDGVGSGGVPRTPLDPCFGDLAYCVSGCQDLTSDPDNCGSCGYLCTQSEMCSSGECVPDPSAGGAGGAGGSAR